jgi:hypothetical protein
MAEEDSKPDGRCCTKCRAFKPWADFCKASRGRFGHNSKCRECMAQYQRENKDRINALSLARYHRLQAPKKAAKAQRLKADAKRCSKCRETKPKSEYGPDARRADGLRPYCRECKAEESRAYRLRNPEVSANASRAWKKRNPERAAAIRRRYQSGASYRAMHAISTRIYLALKGAKSASTEALVGYTREELVRHIERQFLPGMAWSNYGDWHVDHIRPLRSFGTVNEKTIRQAWCLSNLRPLWAKENLRKNAKITHLI